MDDTFLKEKFAFIPNLQNPQNIQIQVEYSVPKFTNEQVAAYLTESETKIKTQLKDVSKSIKSFEIIHEE